jgi:ribosome biogenesis GTPase
MRLDECGWSPSVSEQFEQHARGGLAPGRVIADLGALFRLAGEAGEIDAVPAGRLRRSGERPAVGDWAAFLPPAAAGGPARIEALLPRRGRLARKSAGTSTAEQVVAANVDVVIVVMGLDDDFNLRRLERFLVMSWQGGARPVVLLNKSDLADDPEARRAETEAAAPGVPVLTASCRTGDGLDALAPHLPPGETAALLGSSGVGKSTLINRLLGEEVQATREVRARDRRGRHVTSHRELFRLPGGALLIDNPGVRELAPWRGEQGLAGAFDDVEALAAGCRFRDCTHGGEPGCAVAAAVDEGRLAGERLESYRTLQRELDYLARKQDVAARLEEKRKWRAIHRSMRRMPKPGRGDQL